MEKTRPKDSQTLLRAQMEREVHSKKKCSYEAYQCSQLAAENSKFCMKHILNDKSAQFKQCNYVYQHNGKRCHLPAPKGDKKDYGYCNEHALKATLVRNRQNGKNPPPLSAESLLTNLSHYVKKPRNRSISSSSFISDEDRGYGEDGDPKSVRIIDPFVDIDANSVYNEQCNEILDMCSESESDVEPSTYATVWHDSNFDSSDNESIDSEDEDPLKHANVYTAEEISLITRDKLVRLQSLYIEEYKHLRYLLKERRRKYLHALKREKETCCNICNQVRDNPKEQRLYEKLKHYNKYHKAFGEDAILEKRLHDLRTKITDGLPVKSSNYSKCQFTQGGVKCGERTLPLTKHCRKHILEDPHQVLFKACGKLNGDVECNTPVEALFDDSTCKLHMEIPLIRSYTHPRKESESEPEDVLDMPLMTENDSVKTEMIDYSIPALTKMETLPSILFEDSVESLHYSTSEFTETFADNSVEVPKTPHCDEVEVNVTDNLEKSVTPSENEPSDVNPKEEEENTGVEPKKTHEEVHLFNEEDTLEDTITITTEAFMPEESQKSETEKNDEIDQQNETMVTKSFRMA
ncbi:KAT8 regulatory NSL complex subunit 2 isoform X2 [Anthonomus grandis grandis]|uniref:KAT8 regulatory NSL complex subunit 2 isoform X2 n=1 Tax=Anthonomus grandis grandis TaxID=2921223 RepID=UPI0021655EDA|nr:KAT8 regulatory NSL complex subunit 2 isoform X2 [Anthonomus grandis grandis]